MTDQGPFPPTPSPPFFSLPRTWAQLGTASPRLLADLECPPRPLDHAAPCPIPVHDYSAHLLRPVSAAALAVYAAHVRVGREGPGPVGEASMRVYREYVARVGGRRD